MISIISAVTAIVVSALLTIVISTVIAGKAVKSTLDQIMEAEATAWLQAEAVEEPEVDWSKVPVDTPIWVRDSEDNEWRPRYFAKYEDGLVHSWYGGTTSWSTNADTMFWNYAKLAKEDKR